MKIIIQLFGLFFSLSAMGQTPIPTDTYFNFPLDGNATDVGGDNHTGSIVGGVTATADRLGNQTGALQFNGTNGYIDIPYSTSVGTADFSVSYWANPSASNAGFVLSKEQSGVAPNQFRMGSSGDYFGCFSDNTSNYGGGLSYIPTVDVWSFYTITRQGNSIKLYVNGVYKSSLTTAGTINHSNTLNYRIGIVYNGSIYYNGKIDDLRMFKHALSTDEITALYTYSNPPVNTSFAGGIGTIADPYQVSTPAQLNSVRDFYGVGINFKLINNIDLTSYLSGVGYNEGAYWSPIADMSKPFKGTFDGNNYVISGLKSNHPSDFAVGLFGVVGSGAVLTNIGISIDAAEYMNGASYVGGLVGYNDGGTINGCNVYCVYQIAHGSYAGGLVGYNDKGIIQECCVSGVTGGEQFVGGLVGFNTGSIGKCCVIKGDVGGSSAGGLVGVNNNGGIITNCYSRASVGGLENIGGLVGVNNAVIMNSYATGEVVANFQQGGLVGNSSGGSVLNSFWDKITTKQNTSIGSVNTDGKTTVEMNLQSTFIGWDFVNETTNGTADIWSLNCAVNNCYPCFKWLIPVLTTDGVSGIAKTTATVNSSIIQMSQLIPTAHGVCWNQTGMPTTADNIYNNGTVLAAGAYITILSGLTPNTKYYVRAYATNAVSTVYGNEVNFTTLMSSGLDNTTSTMLSLYPNPTNKGFAINIGYQKSILSIYDLSGSLILTKQISGKSYIDVTALPSGIYMVKANGMVGKLIKK